MINEITTFKQAEEYLYNVPKFTTKSTPEMTRAFYEFLGCPGEKRKIVHVAGTNGKGSVCTYLSSILTAHGYKTAMFTSPHLISMCERFRIDGELMSKDDFMRYFETAAELGARFINLHGDRPTGKLSVEEYCQRFGLMAEDAKSLGITLCQENVNGYRSADPEFLKDMVKELGDLASFTLDIKQCIRAGYTVPEIAEAMDWKICHVHISDHSPAGDCLLPGRGGFDFSALFKELKAKGYKGDFMIEVYRNAYNETSEIFENFHSFKEQNKNLL